jgi:uncharacterized Rmd1/YagE family protein
MTGIQHAVGMRLEGGPTPSMEARALLIGARIDTRNLRDFVDADHLPEGPGGAVFAFGFGVVVLFGVSSDMEATIIERLKSHVFEPVDVPEVESLLIEIQPDAEEQIDAAGTLLLQEANSDRLLLIATALARSVFLALDEQRIADAFDRVDPLIQDLRTRGRAGLPIRRVMQQIGEVLAARHRMVGRAQISEKPDLLWDHPELERLYARLDAEYELGERAHVIERKLDAIGDTVDTLLDLVKDKRSVRLELAIIALIAFEIILTLLEKAGF